MKWSLGLVLISGCAGSTQCYPESAYPNYTSYAEPLGAPTLQDAQTLSRVEACLAPLRDKWLSPEEAVEAQCSGTPVLKIRSCLKVAVAPDWHHSPCTGDELFPCSVPNASCEAKGQHPTPQCPCFCRAMIQDNTTIWVTPNRHLLAAYAVTLLTSCNYPWTPTLAPCSEIEP